MSPTVVGSMRLLQPGSTFIKAGTELPQHAFPLRRIAGWNLIEGVNAHDISVAFRAKGWHLLSLVPKVEASAIALTFNGALRKALKKILRQIETAGFNSFEISAVQRRTLVGLKHVRLIVHPHHVRKNPYLRDLDPRSWAKGAWDFKRIHQAIGRQTRQLKAI